MKKRVAIFAILLVAATMACLGGPSLAPPEESSGGDVPLYSGSDEIPAAEEDKLALVSSYLGTRSLVFYSTTDLRVTADGIDPVVKQVESELPDAGWRLEEEWSVAGRHIRSSIWRNGDLVAAVVILDNLDSAQISDFHRRYGLPEFDPGSTMIITHVWDKSRPAISATEMGNSQSLTAEPAPPVPTPGSQPLTETACGFDDEFSAPALDPRWKWVDPKGDSTADVSDNPGYLTLFTPDGGHDLYINNDAPRLLQNVNGNFEVKTRVTISPRFNYQGAGLLLWQDSTNFVQINRTLVRGVDMAWTVGGIRGSVELPFTESTTFLKIEVKPSVVSGLYSDDGSNWTEAATTQFDVGAGMKAGPVLFNEWQDNPISARFDYVRFDSCQVSTGP